MKICVPTATDAGLEAPVFGHFGSAPFFTVVDTDDGKVEVIPNTNSHHAHGTCSPTSLISARDTPIRKSALKVLAQSSSHRLNSGCIPSLDGLKLEGDEAFDSVPSDSPPVWSSRAR